MHWVYLYLAIVLEVSATICMKLSQGLTKVWPSLLMFAGYGLCFSFLSFALKKLDISVVYAVWSATGTALIAMLGILWFKEPVTALKIPSLGLIILGVIGLNLSGGTH